MGRPLFSQYHQTPAVRVEPEQPQPACEKWTYWNAFDPDSDEFFERDDAVYEAFVPQDGTALPQPPTLMDMPLSSSSSEASSSGRGSPTDEAGTDLSTEEIDLAFRREAELTRLSATREDDIQRRVQEAREAFADSHSPTTTLPAGEDSERVLRYIQGLDNISRQNEATTQSVRERVLPDPEPASAMAELAEFGPLEPFVMLPARRADVRHRRGDPPAPSSEQATTARGILVAVPSTLPASSAATATTHSTPDRPSTPPNGSRLLNDRLSTPPNRSPALDVSPSPPPSVTPRLYSWSSRNPVHATPTSPGPSGPLRNRSARLSVEHISPLPDASSARTRSRPRIRYTGEGRQNLYPNAPRVDTSSWIRS
ncbi:uncharacterized protein C8Q71DRAFT_777294 [Rhodofomes roseus]|uniref:Uncharacterized protein n=1 Tax=Rhodofomes roseus TaxID=34475 RepID=A0A4Y9YMF9_9APHY|nr:uncharacterized protein C8Q71DRAFT_777294 [Rhodofomes roseus]KAH9832610.1 hypothetical protein C8Q71DRAFT_777294 [Rhodofomes roseus]TFY63766.1 hypothetical protein EVJ58_g3076 [Rhodofomes roseus]